MLKLSLIALFFMSIATLAVTAAALPIPNDAPATETTRIAALQ